MTSPLPYHTLISFQNSSQACSNFNFCETCYAPNGFVRDQDIEVGDSLPNLGGPLIAKIIDGASGQNNIEAKLKHRRARCLLFYLQGDTSKLGQPNDQTPNKAVQDLIRRGIARYDFFHGIPKSSIEISPTNKAKDVV